ncbi:MAG: CapA family protein, partial [Pseudonocardiaceae bacterium]
MGLKGRNALAAGGLLGAALVLVYSVVANREGGRQLSGQALVMPPRASASAAPAPVSFMVVASGDVLIHPALTEQAMADSGTAVPDFGPLLSGVAPVVSAADLALCHLEVPLAEPAGPYAGYPSFNAAPQVVTALAETGYDSCSTASNHTLDQGRRGVLRTLDALDAAGLAHTGSARSALEAARPLIHDLGVARVAQISFTYGYNGLELPPDAP